MLAAMKCLKCGRKIEEKNDYGLHRPLLPRYVSLVRIRGIFQPQPKEERFFGAVVEYHRAQKRQFLSRPLSQIYRRTRCRQLHPQNPRGRVPGPPSYGISVQYHSIPASPFPCPPIILSGSPTARPSSPATLWTDTRAPRSNTSTNSCPRRGEHYNCTEDHGRHL